MKTVGIFIHISSAATMDYMETAPEGHEKVEVVICIDDKKAEMTLAEFKERMFAPMEDIE